VVFPHHEPWQRGSTGYAKSSSSSSRVSIATDWNQVIYLFDVTDR